MNNQLLDKYRTKQPFRVSKGKKYIINGEEKNSKWFPYEIGNKELWNLREILNDEIVIEFDMPKDWDKGLKEFQEQISIPAIDKTSTNLAWNGITCEVWDHKGKSPHLHIHDLPIAHLEKDKLKMFKELFIKKYTPEKYLPYVDFSLCGIHLLAIEGVEHWKGKYSIKKLLHRFKCNVVEQ